MGGARVKDVRRIVSLSGHRLPLKDTLPHDSRSVLDGSQRPSSGKNYLRNRVWCSGADVKERRSSEMISRGKRKAVRFLFPVNAEK